MYSDITGIILSGGKSLRMGVNKSLLTINGQTIIELVRDLMQSIFSEVIIITNVPQAYEFLGLKIYEDIYKGYGPLAGIHSGLLNSSTEKNFIISCDVPLMTKDMIKYLTEFPTNKLITVAKADGFIQQLVGVYHKQLITSIEDILNFQRDENESINEHHKRGCKVSLLLEKVGSEIINTESLSFYHPDIYFNMNRQKDFDYLKEKLI